MGQMTYAVMLGVKMDEDPPESFEDGWWTLLEGYKPGKGPAADMNDSADVLGFWIAVGASGERGVPRLAEDFALYDIRNVEEYGERIAACERAWPKFQQHAAKMGVDLGAPLLWLVQTEVA